MAETKFFTKFPQVDYRFGDNEDPVGFQDLSVFIDTFEQVREEHVYYQSYYIKNNQRPDQLSYEVYGTTDYYWTFFLNNESLRINGWPLDNWEVYSRAKEYYPHKAIATNGTTISAEFGGISEAPLCVSERFVIGACTYHPNLDAIGKIVKIDHNLATLWIESDYDLDALNGDQVHIISEEDGALWVADQSSGLPSVFIPLILESTSVEISYDGRDAIHHYEDFEENWVYPTSNADAPYGIDWSSVSTMQSITYLQRLQTLNDEKRGISIIRPETVLTIVSEYNDLLKQRL